MRIKKDNLIPVCAIFILLIGAIATIYVNANKINVDSEMILINDVEYSIDQIFLISQQKILEDINASGIALDDLIISTGIECPSCWSYNIIGSDGYQKSVTWENIKNGIITHEKKVIFSDLPKAFNIKDVVKIEAISNE